MQTFFYRLPRLLEIRPCRDSHHAILEVWRSVQVECHRGNLLPERCEMDIGNKTDNLVAVMTVTDRQSVLLSCRFVENQDLLTACEVILPEIPSFCDADTHSLEICRADRQNRILEIVFIAFP